LEAPAAGKISPGRLFWKNGDRLSRRVTLAILLIVIAFASSARAHDVANLSVSEITIEQRLDAQLPMELEFTDENSVRAPLRRFISSRPALLAFVYYECPQVCPLVLDGLVRSLRVLTLTQQEYEVVVVSIDPNETHVTAAQKKKEYLTRLTRLDAAPRWHFLTGDAAAIGKLTDAAGFRYRQEPNTETTQYVHPAASLVLTPGGKISRYLYGFDYPPKDLRLALIEASDNRIGSYFDQLLLLCYQYDPAKGKYTLAILNVLRFSGIATVLAMGGFIGAMLRREKIRLRAREVR
jgi:protein SCO1/2